MRRARASFDHQSLLTDVNNRLKKLSLRPSQTRMRVGSHQLSQTTFKASQ